MEHTLTRAEVFTLPADTIVSVRWKPQDGPSNQSPRIVKEGLWNPDESGGILYLDGLTLVFIPEDDGYETWGHTEDSAPLVRGELRICQVEARAEAA